MSDNSSHAVTSGGVGFFGLLTIVLVILKATGFIDWSWWLVFAPLIISTVIGLAVFVLIILLAGVMYVLENKK